MGLRVQIRLFITYIQLMSSQSSSSCAGGCGFHGSKAMMGYCSLCYKKMCPEKAFKLSAKPAIIPSIIKENECKQIDIEPKEDDKCMKIEEKKNRCWICRKKLSLAAQFQCKCDYVFWSQHRYYDAHQCTAVDASEQHKKILKKNNQKVAASKVPEFI